MNILKIGIVTQSKLGHEKVANSHKQRAVGLMRYTLCELICQENIQLL